MKRLTLIRHAKSSWDSPSLRDYDRPLNPRGKKDGLLMAMQYKELFPFIPDKIVVSPAVRTRQTAGYFLDLWEDSQVVLNYERTIYEASYGNLLSIVHSWDDGYDNAIMIGHNPGTLELANLLADNRPLLKLPTCSIIVLQAIKPWKDWGSCVAERTHYLYPTLFKEK